MLGAKLADCGTLVRGNGSGSFELCRDAGDGMALILDITVLGFDASVEITDFVGLFGEKGEKTGERDRIGGVDEADGAVSYNSAVLLCPHRSCRCCSGPS